MNKGNNNMDKLTPKDGASPDIVPENIERLREIFPEVFADGSVDFDALKETLGEYVDEREERYSFTWHGKSRARRIAQMPSSGTLLPCPEESVNWDETKNIFIEGDNLEVLKLLQKSYHRKVKMIYIDPPYNTGNEFIYPDKFQDNLETYLKYTGQVDDEGFKLSANAETSGRYHTNWLNMMYPRLRLARNLLMDTGIIFISIDDTEMCNLRRICDEVIGEENFVANIIWQKKYAKQNDSKGFSVSHDHILLYARSVEAWQPNHLPRTEAQLKHYKNPDNHPLGRWQSVVYTCSKTSDERPNLYYPIIHPRTGQEVWPKKSRVWYCDRAHHQRNVEEGRIWWGDSDEKPKPRLKSFLKEVKGGIVPDTLWLREDVGDNQDSKRRIMDLFDGRPLFDTPKPVRLITKMMQIASSEPDGIVLDFFAGSASTAEAVVQKNIDDESQWRYVLVQLPEPTTLEEFPTISEIARERIRRSCTELKEQNSASVTAPPDFGFRAFKLSSSNIKPWDADFDDLDGALLGAIDNIKSDRSQEDVLYELLLKYGLDLAIPTTERTIAGKKVFIIGAGALVVCLDSGITLDVVRGIADLKDELKPEIMRVVFKDSGFKDDVVKTNAVQILKLAGVDDVKSL